LTGRSSSHRRKPRPFGVVRWRAVHSERSNGAPCPRQRSAYCRSWQRRTGGVGREGG
jgi:hypothetical protein